MAMLVPASVEREFEKNPKLTKEDLDSLRQWLDKQPHLPEVPDLDLIMLLHSCQWSVEQTKHTIDIAYTIKTHLPEFFSNRDPKHRSMQESMKVLNLFFLPKAKSDGSRVFYASLNSTDPSKFNLESSFKYFFLIQDLMLQQFGTFRAYELVFDMKGVVLGHLPHLNPSLIKKFTTYLQEAMEVRFRCLHFVNPVPFIETVMGLVRQVTKPEVSKLIRVHPNMESFFELVERKIMPKEFGGAEASCRELAEATANMVMANKEFFQREEKLRVVETLRPGKAKSAGELFGVEGSFKKLDFD